MCFLGKNGRKDGSSSSSNHERHKSRKKSNAKYKELDLQVVTDQVLDGPETWFSEVCHGEMVLRPKSLAS